MTVNKKRYLLWLTIATVLVAGLASCSTVHKTKTTAVKNSDSLSIKNSEQIHTAKKDSTGYKQTDSSFKELITINFDTAAAVPGTPIGDPANEYEAAEIKPIHGPFVYEIAGTTIKSARPIHSATIERSGHKTQLDISNVKTSDSSSKKAAETIQVKKQEKIIAVEKTSRRMPFYISLLLLLLVVAAALYALRRYKII